MKIISWNVNGIRAVYKKNFLDFVKSKNPDILCLQEIKANEKQLVNLDRLKNYFPYFNSAEKKGYSGVAVYTKKKPLKIEKVIGFDLFDKEGRILILHFKKFILINIYIPHGGRQKEKLEYKLETYSFLFNLLKKLENKNIILTGDFNIAHNEIDLARPKNNKKNIMFTKDERNQIDKLINFNFIDTFRSLHEKEIKYSWWPYSVNARERNIGWRIDYIFISKKLEKKLKNSSILSEINGSDHCPIEIDI